MTVSVPLSESYWPADTTRRLWELSVGQLLREAAAKRPDHVALVEAAGSCRRWTYAQLLADAERVARSLLARYEPGDHVALWAPNQAEWLLLQYGIALAGMVLVTVNPAYRAREVRHVLSQSQSVALFHVEEYRGHDMAATAAEVRADLPLLRDVFGLGGFVEFLASGDPSTPLPDVEIYGPCQIQYTSGTTGAPKGAILHHFGLVNVTRFVAERAGFDADGVWINAMPLFHVGGCGLAGVGVLTTGGTHVILPGFEPGAVLEAFERERGTTTLAVPTMLVALLDHPDITKRDLSSLKAVMTGAAPVPVELARRVLIDVGVPLSNLFGQTEVNGVISQTTLDDSIEDQVATIGRPSPQVEVKIADPATGEILPIGQQGEICARGYQRMLGYYHLPEATASTIDDEGWLHLGDLGSMDGRGYLTITGRLKEVIIRGGENIYPREIEEVLFEHPGVAEVAIVGVPDEKWGETVAAVLRPLAGRTRPTPDELRAFCREHLASYKTPAAWYFVSEFPLTPSGKVQKYVLVQQITSGALPTA